MQSTAIHDIVANITRTEAGKLTSVLTRVFGTHNLEMAEDVVQDVLIKALETWQEKGVPENPEAWLFRAAKNRAIDIIRSQRRKQTFAADINTLLESEYTATQTLEECFTDNEIRDDQLRMMFACCHPDVNRQGQIALILKTLSGFSVSQIARAFITTNDTIEKRLYRARQVFREKNIGFEIPSGDMLEERLDNILETIYLLFNEAHSASYHDSLVRIDLAADSINLCNLLANHPITGLPRTNALLALLYFHTARMLTRTDVDGNLVLMKDQDRSLWNWEMIHLGMYHLQRASTGNDVSRYHLEAAIAYEHCKAATYGDTDWEQILHFYNILMKLVPTPVVMLNRAIAIKELNGAADALKAIKEIPGIDYLQNYYLLHAILGELFTETGNTDSAKKHYEKALQLAVSDAEKRFIQRKLNI
ncbi:MAG: sigma-70 family RNA polymerase sigma factor [Bacteroidetes bacterium]|nr:sigma-70 family RNA polymerase sigma factor [Bacteroidota bacterium]